MKRTELVAYLDEFLRIQEIRDYGPPRASGGRA